MNYVIVDPEGSTRGRFRSLSEVREWARTLKAQEPDLLDELLLLTYDATGEQVASQWLSDFVPDVPASITATSALQELRSVAPSEFIVSGVGAQAGWFGTATSTHPASRRQQRRATDTAARELAETVAG